MRVKMRKIDLVMITELLFVKVSWKGGNINILVKAPATAETWVFLVSSYCFFDEEYLLYRLKAIRTVPYIA